MVGAKERWGFKHFVPNLNKGFQGQRPRDSEFKSEVERGAAWNYLCCLCVLGTSLFYFSTKDSAQKRGWGAGCVEGSGN